MKRTTKLGIGVQPPGLGKLVADLRGILKIGGTVAGIELSHSWTVDGDSTNDMEWKGAMALLIQHQYGK